VHHERNDSAERDATNDDGPPAAVGEWKVAVCVVGAKCDAGQGREVAREKEVRRNPRVHTRSKGVVGLRQDVRDRQERGDEQRGTDRRGLEVLTDAVALQAEIRDAGGHEREGDVEEWDGIRNREPVGRQEGGEKQQRRVPDPHNRDQHEQDRHAIAEAGAISRHHAMAKRRRTKGHGISRWN
jgi:hypothetical protein